MDGPRVLGSNHTSFTVSDLDATIGFFRDCLGHEVVSRGGRDIAVIERIVGVPGADIEVAYLRGPDNVVELIRYASHPDAAAVTTPPSHPGSAHLAYNVRGIDALIETAASYGFDAISPPVIAGSGGPNAGHRVSYLRDRDGLTIELIEAP